MTPLLSRLASGLLASLVSCPPASLAQSLSVGVPVSGAAVAASPSTVTPAAAAPVGGVLGSPGSPATGISLDLAALIRVMGLPPAPSSHALQDDLAILRWLQANRTPQMVAATWMTLGREPEVFSSALGVDLSKVTPRLAASLRQFLALVDEAVDRIKPQIRRPRPYVSHPDLRPCLPPESGFSFPSGHSSWYTAASLLLSDLVPERRERLEEMGRHGAASRVMCGVHYPSDVMAAQRLATAAAAQIIASPQWQRFRRDPAIEAEVGRVRQARPESLPLLVR